MSIASSSHKFSRLTEEHSPAPAPALNEVKLGPKKGTASQKWQWTREGYLQSFLGRFLETDSGTERFSLYATTKANLSDVFGRWRYNDDLTVEHIKTGLVLDAHACPRWAKVESVWVESYDGRSVGLRRADNSDNQKWIKTQDGCLQNMGTSMFLEVDDTQPDVHCFDEQGLIYFLRTLETGSANIDEEGNFLRGKGGPERVTRVWQAVYSGNLFVLEKLFEKGATLNHIAANRCNPLCVATSATTPPHLQVAQYLFRNGDCDPFLTAKGWDWEGFSPFAAAIVNMPQFALLVLTKRAEIVPGARQSTEWRFDFSGIELNENHDSLVMLRSAPGSDFSTVLDLMVSNERKELLATPIMQKILRLRWEAFGKDEFKQLFAFSLFYCTMFVVTVLVWPWGETRHGGEDYHMSKGYLALAICFLLVTLVHFPLELKHLAFFSASLAVSFMALQLCFSVLLIIHACMPTAYGLLDITCFAGVAVSLLLPFVLMRLSLVLENTGPVLMALHSVMLVHVPRVLTFVLVPFVGLYFAFYIVDRASGSVESETFEPPENTLDVIRRGLQLFALVLSPLLLAVLIAVVISAFSNAQEAAFEKWLLVRANFLQAIPKKRKHKYVNMLVQAETKAHTDFFLSNMSTTQHSSD